MCNIPPLGAFIKGTNEYIYPKIATKTTKYECPSCHKDLMIKKGSIRIHHFAHCRSDSPCNYYSRPSESDIHKDAKILLKTLLERKTKIIIKRKCCGEYEIPIITDSSKIVLEHRFEYNGLKIADVAYIDSHGNSSEIKYIFEICHTHKTDNDKRPEPWFEINASKLLQIANGDADTITIPCMRTDRCDLCLRKDELIKLEPCRLIYVDIPYSDREYAKRMGMQFDFKKSKKWTMMNTNRNRDKILSKYKEINYDESNENISRLMAKIIINRKHKGIFKIFIMATLQQKVYIPIHKLYNEIVTSGVKIDESDYDYEEFDFDARYDHTKIRKNKELINIFNRYLFGRRLVIYTRAKYTHVYLVNGDDYDKYDYYGFDYFGELNQHSNSDSDSDNDFMPDISNYHMPYPYVFSEEYHHNDTASIIKNLLKYFFVGHIWDGK